MRSLARHNERASGDHALPPRLFLRAKAFWLWDCSWSKKPEPDRLPSLLLMWPGGALAGRLRLSFCSRGTADAFFQTKFDIAAFRPVVIAEIADELVVLIRLDDEDTDDCDKDEADSCRLNEDELCELLELGSKMEKLEV